MSREKSTQRQHLLAEADGALRKMSAQSTLFGHAIANSLGIRPTDLECLDLIQLHGSVTASQLAKATGLTSGAVTGLVDRLEQAGYVLRKPDANDRRRTNIELHPSTFERVYPLYASLHERMQSIWADFDDEQVQTILDFATRSHETVAEETARLRKGTKKGK
ncbi:MarR family winged helix-turn-helix transcriptional regulator [Marinimicrobium alkaliphilum]|uniref:MarR family winged helix-turn-helix transcriptional regulator n=1 Tax=Marinimicrobium alkaliphilum TaxID=2202654 RepID=UPI000DB94547|nr:MarR family transcriptional regulator [Marinimicrobium alkaliphilum]